MTVSWAQLTGDATGIVPKMLIGVTWMFALILTLQMPKFFKMKYMLTFLGFTFPSGAMAVATIMMAGALEGTFYDVLGVAAIVIATVAILGIVGRTIVAAAKGVIFMPE